MNKPLIDFNDYTLEDLELLIIEASSEIQKRREASAQKVKQQIKQLLNESGLSLQEVFEEPLLRKPRKVPPKYRNPDNPDETWSGRGKMPVWLRERVEAGAQREDFLINS